jgi:ABC-type transporter Mla subunit MlaD
MKVTRAQKVRLGVFVFVSLVLLGAMTVVLVGSRLTEKEDTYFARFAETVSGLEAGAPVKYQGVRIGSVTGIEIDRDDITRVLVTLRLKKDTPVKTDSIVVLNTMGITGLRFIELTGGTNESDLLKPGSLIESGASLLNRLTGKADIISEKVELLVNNLIAMTGARQREDFDAIVAHLRETMEGASKLVRDNQGTVDKAAKDLAAAADNLRQVSERLGSTLDTLDLRMNDAGDGLELVLLEVQNLLEEQGRNMSTLLDNANATVSEVRTLAGSPNLKRVPKKVEETVAATLSLVEGTNKKLAVLLGTLQSSAGQVQALLDDKRVDGMLTSLATVSSQLEEAVDIMDLTMRQSREDVFKTLSSLKDVVRNLNDFTQMLLENPAILLRGSQLKERKL